MWSIYTIMIVGSLLAIIPLAIFIWYIPIAVARERNHPQKDAIIVANFVSLLFPPLWLVTIIWCHTVPAPTVPFVPQPVPPEKPISPELQAKIRVAQEKFAREQAAQKQAEAADRK